MLNPEIYVVCVAAKKVGLSHGVWVSADQDVYDMEAAINQMLAKSPVSGAKEWIIEDSDDFFDVEIAENESLDLVREKGRFVKKHGELGAAVLAYYKDLDDAETALDDHYEGEYKSEREFAIELFSNRYAFSEEMIPYIDYNMFRDDIFNNEYIAFPIDDRVHVFSNL